MTRTARRGCALSACLAVIVAVLLLQPLPEAVDFSLPHLDKLVHAAMFCTVALPAMLGLPRRWHGLVWGLVLAYSGLIELVQPYFGRGAEWADLAANGLGAGIALFLARVWRLKRAKLQ
ncbi:MAG: VanZ like family [Roseibaca calidilacus]|uniref:VanZ like family n=1 Tax=Roseibaca calidilacus TaxID=1666912 RepID=A0A0P7X1N1_9RHOB|nr:VanZ family protein [Roseibaca calidilacus]KPP94182.1 MAG: VanZ like family [Roseibaca calidilacus]CUX81416.1 VanZ like family protein [Roseibaca calidilacus]